MDIQFRDHFIGQWHSFFAKAELPITYYYTDDGNRAPYAGKPRGRRCVIGDLAKVRKGRSLRFDNDAIGCQGGKRYIGFSQTLRSNFDYFLSCGIEGVVEGERYKRSPEIVSGLLKNQQSLRASTKYIVFKRIDKLVVTDDPSVVVFFASPDVLSGLFTLANFDQNDPYGVIAPFGAGCASIVYWPNIEAKNEHPRCVLGMFDVSARPYVASDLLTFSIPWSRFVELVGYMDESFLTTKSWKKLRTRIARD